MKHKIWLQRHSFSWSWENKKLLMNLKVSVYSKILLKVSPLFLYRRNYIKNQKIMWLKWWWTLQKLATKTILTYLQPMLKPVNLFATKIRWVVSMWVKSWYVVIQAFLFSNFQWETKSTKATTAITNQQ